MIIPILPILKSLHLIFIVCWFAGLFYFVRLLIYWREALDKEKAQEEILTQQYAIMASRLLWIITWPSSLLTLIFGLLLLLYVPFAQNSWLHPKILFVLFLFIYQVVMQKIYIRLQNKTLDKSCWTSKKLRIANEFPTILLSFIVFLAVLKNIPQAFQYSVVCILGIGLLFMISAKVESKITQRIKKH